MIDFQVAKDNLVFNGRYDFTLEESKIKVIIQALLEDRISVGVIMNGFKSMEIYTLVRDIEHTSVGTIKNYVKQAIRVACELYKERIYGEIEE